ncbi:hypothetical protein LCAM36_1427 [Lacticaseibacillus paracasei]|nr:hypothetical protein LCAM36_1427 [Lacticaseibacillus paracasei]
MNQKGWALALLVQGPYMGVSAPFCAFRRTTMDHKYHQEVFTA